MNDFNVLKRNVTIKYGTPLLFVSMGIFMIFLALQLDQVYEQITIALDELDIQHVEQDQERQLVKDMLHNTSVHLDTIETNKQNIEKIMSLLNIHCENELRLENQSCLVR